MSFFSGSAASTAAAEAASALTTILEERDATGATERLVRPTAPGARKAELARRTPWGAAVDCITGARAPATAGCLADAAARARGTALRPDMAPMAAMVVMIGPNVRLGAFGSGSGPPAQHFIINEQTNRSLKNPRLPIANQWCANRFAKAPHVFSS